ncbi:hypothetical protein THAOC_24132, partial [Thalassiosira oceanica]
MLYYINGWSGIGHQRPPEERQEDLPAPRREGRAVRRPLREDRRRDHPPRRPGPARVTPGRPGRRARAAGRVRVHQGQVEDTAGGVPPDRDVPEQRPAQRRGGDQPRPAQGGDAREGADGQQEGLPRRREPAGEGGRGHESGCGFQLTNVLTLPVASVVKFLVQNQDRGVLRNRLVALLPTAPSTPRRRDPAAPLRPLGGFSTESAESDEKVASWKALVELSKSLPIDERRDAPPASSDGAAHPPASLRRETASRWARVAVFSEWDEKQPPAILSSRSTNDSQSTNSGSDRAPSLPPADGAARPPDSLCRRRTASPDAPGESTPRVDLPRPKTDAASAPGGPREERHAAGEERRGRSVYEQVSEYGSTGATGEGGRVRPAVSPSLPCRPSLRGTGPLALRARYAAKYEQQSEPGGRAAQSAGGTEAEDVRRGPGRPGRGAGGRRTAAAAGVDVVHRTRAPAAAAVRSIASPEGEPAPSAGGTD